MKRRTDIMLKILVPFALFMILALAGVVVPEPVPEFKFLDVYRTIKNE